MKPDAALCYGPVVAAAVITQPPSGALSASTIRKLLPERPANYSPPRIRNTRWRGGQ